MCYKSKTFRKNNYFVLYDLNDDIVCYYDNVEDLFKDFKYQLNKLVYEFNRYNTNVITVIINNKKYKLATFS